MQPEPAGLLTGDPTFRVERPVMSQQWLDLSAIHWRVDADQTDAESLAKRVANEHGLPPEKSC